MTPEEYQQFKNAEKEHLKKLKELKKAVRVLERQKKIQSELEKMSRASEDALQTQVDAVERLAMETAHHEARLDVALDSAEAADPSRSDEALEDELRSARAQALVERLKQSMAGETLDDADFESDDSSADSGAQSVSGSSENAGDPGAADGKASGDAGHRTERMSAARPARRDRRHEEEQDAPNPPTEARPEKTIGRM